MGEFGANALTLDRRKNPCYDDLMTSRLPNPSVSLSRVATGVAVGTTVMCAFVACAALTAGLPAGIGAVAFCLVGLVMTAYASVGVIVSR